MVDYESRFQKEIKIVVLHGRDEATLIFRIVNLNQIEVTEYKRIRVARKCIKRETPKSLKIRRIKLCFCALENFQTHF